MLQIFSIDYGNLFLRKRNEAIGFIKRLSDRASWLRYEASHRFTSNRPLRLSRYFTTVAILSLAIISSAHPQAQNFPSGSSTGGGITWLTVATLPGSPALNTTDGVTDGNGFSCTVGGGSTRVLCRWNGASWDVVNGDPTAAAAVTGAVKTATNGADASFLVPGLNPSPDVSSTPYGIRCDSATATLDRAQTVRFVAGASVATIPDIGTAGCTAGFVTSLIAGVTITVNRTTASTFDIYNGTNPPLTGQTTFSLPAGQHATISPSATGTSWIVRFASAVTGASVTSTTAVTVTNPTINTDTQMIELALPAGFLNKAGMGYTIRAGGLYSNTVATSPALTFNAKLCTVSGCGSGTVVGLAQIVSGATSGTATTNDTWTYSLFAVNNATGATGNLLVKGDPGLTIDLSNVGAAADTIYADVNTAVSGNIDLTAALFLDFTVAQSVAGASNSYKQLSGMIAPHASPAGAGGGGQPIFPTLPGATPTANGNANYDTTNNIPVIGVNGITAAMLTSDPLHYIWDVDYFAANGGLGTHGWSVQGGTGVLGFASGPSANYPMGVRFSSGATSGNFGLYDYTAGTAALTTGNFVGGDFYYFFQLEQNAAAAQQSLRVGHFSASAAGDVSNFIGLRVVETTANNNHFFFVCRSGGVDGTATDTTIPADTAVHKFRIHYNSATSYTMWLDTFTGAGTTVNTGCPGSFSAFEGWKIDTSENVTKFVDVWKWAHGQIVAD